MTGKRILCCVALLAATACATSTRSSDAGARAVRQGLAEQAASRGDWRAAFQAADALLRDDREDADALVLRARAFRHLGMAVEAEQDLRQVVARHPSMPQARGELGVVLEMQGRVAEAFPEHQEAHRLAPGDPRWMNNLAFALLIRGKAKDAIPLLEEALRLEPTSPRLRNNLGFALAATGDYSRASQQFRLGGGEASAMNNLACAYERGNNLPQAYDLYLKAARLDPETERFQANLEHVAAALGRQVPGGIAPKAAQREGKGGT